MAAPHSSGSVTLSYRESTRHSASAWQGVRTCHTESQNSMPYLSQPHLETTPHRRQGHPIAHQWLCPGTMKKCRRVHTLSLPSAWQGVRTCHTESRHSMPYLSQPHLETTPHPTDPPLAPLERAIHGRLLGVCAPYPSPSENTLRARVCWPLFSGSRASPPLGGSPVPAKRYSRARTRPARSRRRHRRTPDNESQVHVGRGQRRPPTEPTQRALEIRYSSSQGHKTHVMRMA